MRGGVVEVYTSHWKNVELADLDCVPVGISRGEPRWKLGFRYRRYPALAPDDLTWALEDLGEFERSYTRQLEALGADRILSDLERIAGGRAVVALCWERPTDDYCHRWTLASWLREQTGNVIPELQAGMLPQRKDVVEQRLF